MNQNKNKNQNLEQYEQLEKYLATLNELEKNAYLIAQQHLGTSFDIERSNGYKEWLKKNTH
jgi:hypothetical protein